MKLEIWSDIVCPWCYVGKRRLETALADFEHAGDVEVTWRSFELDPTAPRGGHPGGAGHAERLAAKYGIPVAAAEAKDAQMQQTAAAEGLDFHLERAPQCNTLDAHRLLHLAHEVGVQDGLKERLMRAYFTDGAAVDDPEVLVDLAVDAGVPEERAREVLGSHEFEDAVRADQRQAAAYGINGVPFFVVDGTYGLSGAQPAAVIRDVLQQAWTPPRALTRIDTVEDAPGCVDGVCDVPVTEPSTARG